MSAGCDKAWFGWPWTAPAAYRDTLKGVIEMHDATVFWNIDKS
jgi:hypothetical protein